MAEIASSVYGILGDAVSDDYKKQSDEIDSLSDYLFNFAQDFGCPELTEKFMGKTIPSDAFSEKMQIVMDDYDNETFWHELETRLGKRDFERTMTKEEEGEIEEKGGWLPYRIHDLYEKWAQEFEKYGVERLSIKS